VCPVAAGVVIGAHDNISASGMTLVIGHGLGWKTLYAHLQARFIGYRERVERRDVTAVMGASGTGASRGGVGVARHLHLTLLGPAWAPLFARTSRQDRPANNLGWRHILDPEEFSLGGRNAFLPYSRSDDAAYDRAFATLHDEAVRVTDDLLDRIGDADAVRTKTREQFERDTHFDYHVDQRIWFLWQRLERSPHPFTDDDARTHRATLLRFMSGTPRFTAPIVEPARRSEYRVRRVQPMKTYDARPM
jgi:Peptidase family M23